MSQSINWLFLGGGNGLSCVMTGVRRRIRKFGNVVVGVAMTDRGGSTGNYREQGDPAWGDVRRVIAATALNRNAKWLNAVDGNYDKLGNGTLHDYYLEHGQADRAIERLSAEFRSCATILPVTNQVSDLAFRLMSGREVMGETAVPSQTLEDRIQEAWLTDGTESLRPILALPSIVEAIGKAEQVVIGPGSLWTSLVAALLPSGIRQAFRSRRAAKRPVIYICSVSTERGETQGYQVDDHLSVIQDYTGSAVTDCLVNSRILRTDRNEDQLGNVLNITERRPKLNLTRVHQADIIDRQNGLRHSPLKLADALLALESEG